MEAGMIKMIISVDECWTCGTGEVTRATAKWGTEGFQHGERNYIHLISIQLVSKHTADATQLHLGRVTCMQMSKCLVSPRARVCVCVKNLAIQTC